MYKIKCVFLLKFFTIFNDIFVFSSATKCFKLQIFIAFFNQCAYKNCMHINFKRIYKVLFKIVLDKA